MATVAEKEKAVVSTEETKKTVKKVEKKEAGLFAILATGGKQYKVSVGDKVKIEKIIGEHAEGDTIIFDKILCVDDGKDTTIGTPYIKGAEVKGELVQIGRAKKVDVVKYRAKSNYFKRNGHRQPFFEVKIIAIK